MYQWKYVSVEICISGNMYRNMYQWKYVSVVMCINSSLENLLKTKKKQKKKTKKKQKFKTILVRQTTVTSLVISHLINDYDCTMKN